MKVADQDGAINRQELAEFHAPQLLLRSLNASAYKHGPFPQPEQRQTHRWQGTDFYSRNLC